MPKIEFIGSGAKDVGNTAANTARLINFYREPVANGGRTGFILRSVPGVQAFVDLDRLFLRAMAEVGDVAYAACGGRLWRIDALGDVDDLGAIPDSEATTICGNNGRVSIVAGGQYFVWDGTTLTQVPVTAVTTAGSCAFLGGYTAVSQANGRLVQWSQLVNAQNMPALHVRASETTDENIVRIVTIQERLVVFKTNSHEQWQVTGLANERALALIVGSQVETGLREFGLIVTYPNGAAFVASDGRVYAWAPGAMQPISTPAVEAAIDTLQPRRMFFYERRGHAFICITFRDGPAWCFDVATGEWHERANGVTQNAWTAVDTVKLQKAWLVGYDDGKIGKFIPVPSEFGLPLRRVAVSRPLWMAARFSVQKLEVFAQVGFGRDADVQYLADQGVTLLGENDYGFLANGIDARTEPLMGLRVSRDLVSWGGEKQRGLGAKGRYDHRITFRAMGQFRNMAVEVSMADAIDVPIYADCDLELS
jgi:hypothetical protein